MDYFTKYIKYKTKYSKQKKLEEEGEIPELKYEGVDIRKNIIINIMRRPKDFSLFWTDDNQESIEKFYNPEKKKCNSSVYKDISSTEYCENNYLFNCFLYRRGYKIIFDTEDKLNKFLESVESIVETPHFDETKPYPFIYYVKILGKDFNSFNVYFSFFLQIKIFQSLCLWSNNLLKKYQNVSDYFGENAADPTNRWSQIATQPQYSNSDIKLQMCIKDEYLFWVIENLTKNLDELKSCGLNCFKFFTPSNYKFKRAAEFFPDHKPNERMDSFHINCKVYKRELLTAPNIVLYISRYEQNMNKLVNKLKSLFPDNLDITDGFPRFNIRLTKNIFFSVGGDNNPKFSLRSVDVNNIPLEYKYIIDKHDKVDINKCKKLNEYSKYLTDHDILILNGGRYVLNNIISYYSIISPSTSFKEVFNNLGLEEFYVCPPAVN
jgi:hypothetical protein